MVELADTVTQIRPAKHAQVQHAYEQGVMARRGTEY
jgi:ATP:corrinoid adenosyltransferase